MGPLMSWGGLCGCCEQSVVIGDVQEMGGKKEGMKSGVGGPPYKRCSLFKNVKE